MKISDLTKEQIKYLDGIADKIEIRVGQNSTKPIHSGGLKLYIIQYIMVADNFNEKIVKLSTDVVDYIHLRIIGGHPKGYSTYDEWHDALLRKEKQNDN